MIRKMVEETTDCLKLMMMMRMGDDEIRAEGAGCLIGIGTPWKRDISWRSWAKGLT